MDIYQVRAFFFFMEHLKMLLLVCIQTSHSFYEVQTIVGSDMMDMCNKVISLHSVTVGKGEYFSVAIEIESIYG